MANALADLLEAVALRLGLGVLRVVRLAARGAPFLACLRAGQGGRPLGVPLAVALAVQRHGTDRNGRASGPDRGQAQGHALGGHTLRPDRDPDKVTEEVLVERRNRVSGTGTVAGVVLIPAKEGEELAPFRGEVRAAPLFGVVDRRGLFTRTCR